MNILKKIIPVFVKKWILHVIFLFTVPKVKKQYEVNLLRIKNKIKNEPLNVLFFVDDISKWKTQSLFDLMISDKNFNPIIAIAGLYPIINDKYNEIVNFFEKKGMPIVNAYKIKNGIIDINPDLKPDIVFYQQPWGHEKCINPELMAELGFVTCYVPYYVPNYSSLQADCQLNFHRMLWRYFTLNHEWRDLFRKCTFEMFRAGDFISTGHTMLDFYYQIDSGLRKIPQKENMVIYAPHWSFNHPLNFPDQSENMSTFLSNGKEILLYAQQHPEIKWIFKPHPRLKQALIDCKVMTSKEVEAYYNAWKLCGDVCLDGNYMELFMKSKAMITDCGSFLTEYFCTEKPLIHLISSHSTMIPLDVNKEMFEQFYKVHNLDEMYHSFDSILLKDEDPMHDQRCVMLRKMGLRGQYAAQNIMNYLHKILD